MAVSSDTSASDAPSATNPPLGAASPAPSNHPVVKKTSRPIPVVHRATPTPATPEPQETEQSEKSQMIAEVDPSVTAAKIAGNPTKYLGNVVELSCTISNVITLDDGSQAANAMCGDDQSSLIVLEGDRIGELDAQESLTVIGTVIEPMEGTNAMGGTMHFPTVDFKYNL